MSKERTEAFSDAVIAVAITLLALNLHVPNPTGAGRLAHRLGEQWPSYAAFVVSFITIGIIWINHHVMLRRVSSVDHSTLMLNLLLLLTICLLPFSTALIAQYINAQQGQNLAAAVWAGSFLLMALGFAAMQRHLLLPKRHLLHEAITPELSRWILRRNTVGLLPYAVATACAFITPYLTLAICAAVAVFYALPGKVPTPSHRVGA